MGSDNTFGEVNFNENEVEVKSTVNIDKDLIDEKLNNHLLQIIRAYKHACAKHPYFPSNMFEQLSIMIEEAGEVAQAVNDFKFSGGSISDIKNELYQTAAMCLRMLNNLNDEL